MPSSYVYRLYDADDNLLYVGLSDVPEKRTKTHKHRRDFSAPPVRTTLTEYASREEAAAAERAAIESELPLHNITYKPGGRPPRSYPGGLVMSLSDVAEHLGIKSESVRALMRRRKIKPVAGYPRSQVEAIERTQGRRTDLKKG
jgi:predicted GIY-YIG superfamily endonuclease